MSTWQVRQVARVAWSVATVRVSWQPAPAQPRCAARVCASFGGTWQAVQVTVGSWCCAWQFAQVRSTASVSGCT